MSNKNDNLLRKRSDIYHETVIKLNNENTRKQDSLKAWEADKGLKPTRKDFEKSIGGSVLSEQEISARATAIADEKIKQQNALSKLNLQQTEPNPKSLADHIKTKSQKEIEATKQDIVKEQQRAREKLVFKKRDNGTDRER